MSKMSVYESSAFDDLWNMDFAGYAEDVLNESADLMLKEMKKNCQTSIQHTGESELINSLKKAKPKKARNGAYIINVGPSGYSKTKVYRAKNSKGMHTSRKYPVSNALKAIWMEYGIPARKIHARPFIGPTVNQTQENIYRLLQKRFEERARL